MPSVTYLNWYITYRIYYGSAVLLAFLSSSISWSRLLIFLTRSIPFSVTGLRIYAATLFLFIYFDYPCEYGGTSHFTFRLGTICIFSHAGGTSSGPFKWCTKPTICSYRWTTHCSIQAGAWQEVNKRFGIWECVACFLPLTEAAAMYIVQ
jgi:hypothetical protein